MATDKIMTTHVGSLVRPPKLVPHLSAILAGRPYDEAAFQRTLAESVAEVVRHQTDIGLDIVNDGEFGKTHWYRYIVDRFSGIASRPAGENQTYFVGKDRTQFSEFYAEYDKDVARARMEWAVTGPVRYSGMNKLQQDIQNLKAALAATGARGAQGFLPVVAPASLVPELKDEFYGDEEKFIYALADALREEYRAITDAGLIVQIDDAWLPAMYERIVPPGTADDFRRWAHLCVDALNHALRGIPEERTRYHICWGSWNGPHTADLPLKDFVDIVLRVNVGGYSVEGANPRHEHEWRVWENVKLPAGRKLIPGVVSHATNIVEHPEWVCDRIVRLAELVGRENVIASTDCGFAQGALYRRVHPSIMWAKLEALVEGARLATQSLFSTRQVPRRPVPADQ
jgi:5-methyltetrahydropteroyltriglutamate--homocysteine methyltransferase